MYLIYRKNSRTSPVSRRLQQSAVFMIYQNMISAISGTLQTKMIFPLRNSSVNVTKSTGNSDLVTLTEEILNIKLHFLYSGTIGNNKRSSPISSRILFTFSIRIFAFSEVAKVATVQTFYKNKN